MLLLFILVTGELKMTTRYLTIMVTVTQGDLVSLKYLNNKLQHCGVLSMTGELQTTRCNVNSPL